MSFEREETQKIVLAGGKNFSSSSRESQRPEEAKELFRGREIFKKSEIKTRFETTISFVYISRHHTLLKNTIECYLLYYRRESHDDDDDDDVSFRMR